MSNNELYPTKKEKVRTEQILDWIFRDASIKHGLKEFPNATKQVNIFEKEPGKFYVRCLKREKDILAFDKNKNTGKPEEIIRQLWLKKLTQEYGYPLSRIEVEHPVWFGSGVEKKSADIVVFYKDKDTVWIVGEIKKPERKEGIKQLKSYLNAEGAPIGFWGNGDDRIVLHRPYPEGFLTLPDLPKVDQTIEELLQKKKTIDDLEKKIKQEGQPNLKDLIVDLEDLVLARRGVDVFEEIFKLIFAKLYDEWAARNLRKDKSVEFRVRLGELDEELYKRITGLFHSAIEKWSGVFSRDEREIKIKGTSLKVAVSHLENTLLFEEDLQIIDEAFEYLITKVYKGEKGQYFTPRHVIKMCVKMLNPEPDEFVLDPGAGSGGFLVLTMFYVWEKLKNRVDQVKYASEYLYGIDFDEKAQKVSKAIMLIAGDGSSNIFRLNSLEPWTWKGEIGCEPLSKFLLEFDDYEKDKENKDTLRCFKFDIVMTNPPFAGPIDDKETLRFYEVAKKNNKIVNEIGKHILFLERCLHYLKPGGRMAIVIPQGVLNNANMEYIRKWLFEKARILSVVGLDVNTFKPHTGTKTSILFLQKWNENEKPLDDYPIFMAVSKKPGKDNSGEYVYKKDDSGNYILDEKGHRIIDHDLDEIAEEFTRFKEKQNFKF